MKKVSSGSLFYANVIKKQHDNNLIRSNSLNDMSIVKSPKRTSSPYRLSSPKRSSSPERFLSQKSIMSNSHPVISNRSNTPQTSSPSLSPKRSLSLDKSDEDRKSVV